MRKATKKLLTLLEKIEESPDILEVVPDDILDERGYYSNDQLHPLVKEAVDLAQECLVTKMEEPDFPELRRLSRAGFRAIAETSQFSFSIRIETTKGDIILT